MTDLSMVRKFMFVCYSDRKITLFVPYFDFDGPMKSTIFEKQNLVIIWFSSSGSEICYIIPARGVKMKWIIKVSLHQYLTLSKANASSWPEMLLRYVPFNTTWENSLNVKNAGEEYQESNKPWSCNWSNEKKMRKKYNKHQVL